MSRQGKGARAKQKQKRLAQKKARKEAMQAQYRAWAEAGQNGKSKRFMAKNQSKITLIKHAVSFCGNLGCSRCFPSIHDPMNARPGTVLYRKRFMQS